MHIWKTLYLIVCLPGILPSFLPCRWLWWRLCSVCFIQKYIFIHTKRNFYIHILSTIYSLLISGVEPTFNSANICSLLLIFFFLISLNVFYVELHACYVALRIFLFFFFGEYFALYKCMYYMIILHIWCVRVCSLFATKQNDPRN